MKKILTLALFCALFAFTANAQNASEDPFRTELKRHLELTNSKKTLTAGVKGMLETFAKNGMLSAGKDIDLIAEDVSNTLFPLMMDEYVVIYKKYFTLDELREINAFLITPIGKKYAESTPKITMESASIGQKYGPKIGEVLQRHLQQ